MERNILSDLIITNIVSATTIYTDKGAKSKKSNRPVWALSLKYEGETEYTCGGREILSNANEIILLPCGSDYEWTCTKPGHCTIIDFECCSNSEKIFSFHISSPDKMLNLFKDIEYKMTLRAPLYRQECIKGIYDIILLLSKEKTYTYSPRARVTKIQPALDYIAKNYYKQVKNDELADLCGLSTVYFRKLFSEVTTSSPISYIHNLRIEKAKEMFASDYTSISSVAHSLGYSNIYDFSRVFKKHTGISPSKYKTKNV